METKKWEIMNSESPLELEHSVRQWIEMFRRVKVAPASYSSGLWYTTVTWNEEEQDQVDPIIDLYARNNVAELREMGYNDKEIVDYLYFDEEEEKKYL